MRRLSRAAGRLAACMLLVPAAAHAQSRGVYPLGMTAVGSGVTPDPGFTYANQLLFYSRDKSKADDGSTLPADAGPHKCVTAWCGDLRRTEPEAVACATVIWLSRAVFKVR